jgi:hypothetical protein
MIPKRICRGARRLDAERYCGVGLEQRVHAHGVALRCRGVEGAELTAGGGG